MHSIGLKINQGFFSKMKKVNSTLSDSTEQPGSAHQGEHLYGFFAIGLVINVVMIIAFFIWAYRQWNKKGSNRE